MKKLIFSLLLVLCLTASVPAMAADTDDALLPDTGGNTAPDYVEADDRHVLGDVLSDWETNGYPTDIGGVFYDQETGKTTILMVNPSAERENELKALVPGAAFLPAAYSYYELLAVLGDITKEMATQQNGEAVIYSAGVGYTTLDGKLTGFGESGKEFRVVVTVDESVYTETANRLHQLYGDMVYVETGTALVPVTDSLHAKTAPIGQFTLIAASMIAALLIVFLLVRRRHSIAMQTANGNTITVSGRMTKMQVMEAVKESAVSPSDAVYARIQKDLTEK